MDIDRQGIERRDFPIARRGYDPAAVEAHLRAIAVEVEELRRSVIPGSGELSVASSAGSQVQSIIQAAETAAGEIERNAAEAALQLRHDADRDAEQTRAEALERARAHVAAVAQVAATLLERVGAMDNEVRTLGDSLRAGAGRLASDLTAVEANMAELYDAASGRLLVAPEPLEAPRPAPTSAFDAELAGAMATPPAFVPEPEPYAEEPLAASVPAAEAHQDEQAPAPQGPVDLDGARLVALNMALNGESREETERYLAENFHLPDRTGLVEEVYAAIEG